MTSVGVYDAKTQLPKLLERVGRGERFLITKHGKPVAQLVPAEVEKGIDVKEAVRQIKELRKGVTLGPNLTLRDLIEEGRR